MDVFDKCVTCGDPERIPPACICKDGYYAPTTSLAGDEDYAWDLNRLIDIRNCSIELTSDEVRDLSRNVTSRLEGKGTYRGAYLVDNSLAHGLARIFNALIENNVSEYRIFHAGDKTLTSDLQDWLDLGHEYAFPDFLTLN